MQKVTAVQSCKIHIIIPAIFGYEDIPAATAQVWATLLKRIELMI